MRSVVVFLFALTFFSIYVNANPHDGLEDGVLLGDLTKLDPTLPPGKNFDLLDWTLSIPVDQKKKGIAVQVGENHLDNGFQVEPLFFTGDDGGMIFVAPNKGAKTSKNTKYTRTELRESLRRGNLSVKTKGPNKNNWVFGQAHSSVKRKAGGVDGMLEATVAVNRVSTTGERGRVGRVIIGQIHADKDEPLRIYYHKLPENDKGSFYIAHEVSKGDDEYYNFVGSRSKSIDSPEDGIRLGEKFSYKVSVEVDQLYVTLIREGKPNITKQIDMSESGYGNSKEYMYFKAGVYNQNNTGDDKDYVQATFYHLENSHKGYKHK